MVTSNSTNKDQGAIGEFAIGEFVLGTGFTSDLNPRPSWSEPVRQKIGIHASEQPFFFYGQSLVLTETIFYDKWAYQWSEPVRKKRGLPDYLQRFHTSDTIPVPTSKGIGWYRALESPVRIKVGLRAQYHPFLTQDSRFILPPDLGIQGWFKSLEEPPILRKKRWIGQHLHPSFFYEPRMLPNPNVTGFMSAIETNRDIALFAINVVGSGTAIGIPRAQVSIVEVPAIDGGAVGISED